MKRRRVDWVSLWCLGSKKQEENWDEWGKLHFLFISWIQSISFRLFLSLFLLIFHSFPLLSRIPFCSTQYLWFPVFFFSLRLMYYSDFGWIQNFIITFAAFTLFFSSIDFQSFVMSIPFSIMILQVYSSWRSLLFKPHFFSQKQGGRKIMNTERQLNHLTHKQRCSCSRCCGSKSCKLCLFLKPVFLAGEFVWYQM